MFVDIVNSTERANSLDPEDLRELVHGFQDAVSEAVEPYGGFIARFLGDGAFVYFGWPLANEDDATRAIKASVAALARIAGLRPPDGRPVDARVGIATGIVVIGDVIGNAITREQGINGEPPFLASRLQGVAGPGEIVIGQATQRLARNWFETAFLGDHQLKGFAEPTPAWRVLRERYEDARDAGEPKPAIGRDSELNLMLDRWGHAQRGRGQGLIVSGEPGIGKSCLTETFIARLGSSRQHRIFLRCSPYQMDTALWPVIRHLTIAAGIEAQHDAAERFARLEALLGDPAAAAPTEMTQLAAALLDIEPSPRYTPLDLPTQVLRARTLRTLAEYVLDLADDAPTCVLLEDAHWIDPTTLEFLNSVLDQIADQSVLVLATSRPGARFEIQSRAHVARLTITRLPNDAARAILDTITGGKALPPAVEREILAKTDGVPLFVEELTRTVLESGFLKERQTDYAFDGPLPALAIPSSLQDSFTARLDRTAGAKRIAQAAACIGRDFEGLLLTEVASGNATEVADGLIALDAADVVHRTSGRHSLRYSFRHALLRDVAYESLLREERRGLHARIAAAIVARVGPDADEGPALLAHHYAMAEQFDQAAAFALAAARDAAAKSAGQEAIAHYRRATAYFDRLPPGRSRSRLEIETWVELGGQLISVQGNAAPEVEAAFSTANALAAEAGAEDLQFQALRGLQTFRLVGGAPAAAVKLGRELSVLAEAADDDDKRLQAARPLGLSLMYLGEFAEAETELSRALALYDAERHSPRSQSYASDPGVLAHCNLGWVRWFSGDHAGALSACAAAIAHAEALDHPHSLAFALSFSASVRLGLGDMAVAANEAARIISVSEQHGFAYWPPWGHALKGWIAAHENGDAQGLEQLSRALAMYENTGGQVILPYFQTLAAEAHLSLENVTSARALLTSAIAAGIERRIVFYLPESFRLLARADVMSGDAVGAAKHLTRALEVAEEQGSRSLELRALVDLVRLDPGAPAARDRLATVLASFPDRLSRDLPEAEML